MVGDRREGGRGDPRGGELVPRKPRGSGDRGRLGAVRFDHSAGPTWAAGFASEILRGQRRQHRFEIGREAFVFIGHSGVKPFGLSPAFLARSGSQNAVGACEHAREGRRREGRLDDLLRSAERLVGNEWVSTYSSRW